MATTKIPAAAKKAAPKKPATTKAPAKKVAVKKPAAKKVAVKKTSAAKPTVSAFERYKMIEVAAYFLAEKKGFSGNSADYWTAAEKEINKKLAKNIAAA